MRKTTLTLAIATAMASVASAQLAESPVRGTQQSPRMPRHVSAPAPKVSMGHLDGATAISIKPQATTTATTALPTLYGSVLYSDSWGDLPDGSTIPYGVYELLAAPVIYPSPMCVDPELNINGGGCYSDHQIHYRLYFMDANGDEASFFNYYTVVNTDYWRYVVDPICSYTDNTVANDMTWDRTTGRIYGAVWGNFDGGYNRLATIDPNTGATEEIATIPDMACLAADNFGQLYGVSLYDGILYKFDKATGAYTEVGNTGVKPMYTQSATVDPATNTIYWAASTANGDGLLYTLNTSTGKAELVGRFAGNEEISCLFIEAAVKGLNAPGELKNFATKFDGSASSVSFTLPTTAFDGSALSGNLDVYVYVDGVQAIHTTGTPGQTVNYEIPAASGDHSVVAFAANAVGEGPKSTVRHFAGSDVPGAPANLLLTIENGRATLTWDAPAAGLHGGMIDASSLRYDIVRYPGGNVCATGHQGTTFAENLPAGIANYYYTVTASSADGQGGTATSNSVFTGTTLEIPYTNEFSNAESLLGFTIIDGDANGYTWEYKHLTPYGQDAQDIVWTRYNSTEQCDDWLIFPPIQFEKSASYELRFKARAFDADSPERFEVKMGAVASVDAQTKTILPSVTVTSEAFEQYSVPFTVDTDGVAFMSFHCISSAGSYRLILDDVEIKATASADVPAAVTDLKAVPDANGMSAVTLSFTTPTVSYSGARLTDLTEVAIYRGDAITPAHVITNPGIGRATTWTDNQATLGNTSYRVICSNAAGQGLEASVNVYVGVDKPMAVTNLDVRNENECAIITWTAPTAGVNGSVLDSKKLTYLVRRNDGTVISEGLGDTWAKDIYYSDAPGQIMCYYQVEAVYCGTETSAPALSEYVVFGPDYPLPFKEGFPYDSEVSGFTFQNLPWILSRLTGHTSAHWTIRQRGIYPDATPVDGDGGMATFLSFDLDAGDTERLTSPRIDLTSAERPVLTFGLYRTTLNAGEEVTVEISHNNHVFETLATVPVKSDKDGWEEISIEIPRRLCLPQAQISFKVTSARGYNVHLDNIAVKANTVIPEIDLEAVSLDVPDMMPGVETPLTMKVYNNGSRTVSDYTVELYVNGQKAISQKMNAEIAPGEEMDFVFKLTPETSDLGQTYAFKGHIAATGDQNAANDYTIERSIVVGAVGVADAAVANVKVTATEGAIVIEGGEDLFATVATPSGVCIANRTLGAHEVIPAVPGLYVVSVAGKATKVVVK